MASCHCKPSANFMLESAIVRKDPSKMYVSGDDSKGLVLRLLHIQFDLALAVAMKILLDLAGSSPPQDHHSLSLTFGHVRLHSEFEELCDDDNHACLQHRNHTARIAVISRNYGVVSPHYSSSGDISAPFVTEKPYLSVPFQTSANSQSRQAFVDLVDVATKNQRPEDVLPHPRSLARLDQDRVRILLPPC